MAVSAVYKLMACQKLMLVTWGRRCYAENKHNIWHVPFMKCDLLEKTYENNHQRSMTHQKTGKHQTSA